MRAELEPAGMPSCRWISGRRCLEGTIGLTLSIKNPLAEMEERKVLLEESSSCPSVSSREIVDRGRQENNAEEVWLKTADVWRSCAGRFEDDVLWRSIERKDVISPDGVLQEPKGSGSR